MTGRNFLIQNQARMIYKDLRESHSLFQGRTQYFKGDDRCFRHLAIIRCLPDEHVCRIVSDGNCVFRSFYKTDLYGKM